MSCKGGSMRLNGFRTYRIALAAVVLALLLTSLASPAHAQTTPRFSDLTFNTSSDGMGRTYFPSGTTQIFARWNFQNIPAGSRLRRQWFRNGMLFIEKEEAWTWGVSGRLTNISIYDFN